MSTKKELLYFMKQGDKVLKLIENQTRDDEDTLTWSDLQGAVDAIIRTTYIDGKIAGNKDALQIVKSK